MDIFAHGLVTYAASKTTRRILDWRWLVFFGILPDLIWTPFTLYSLVVGEGLIYHWTPYNVSHSLVLWLGVSALATLRWRRTFLFTWPYALHLLIDIPGHLDMPTPILWPISTWHINGWFDWLSWPWLIGTYAALGAVYGYYWWRKKAKDKNP